MTNARPNELLVGLWSDPEKHCFHPWSHLFTELLGRRGRCLEASAVIPIVTERFSVAANLLAHFNELNGFLYVFNFTLRGNKPDEHQWEKGAACLGHVKDPQIIKTAFFYANKTIDEVAEHLAGKAIG